MKKILISQSNYIPWKGYFEMISKVDEFIIYDDVQYTKNDWRNRNKIKTPNGVNWITIPVRHRLSQNIKDIKISDPKWNLKHWKSLQTNYSKAKHFNELKSIFEPLYFLRNESFLSEINYAFIKAINAYLGIRTTITRSSDYELKGDRSERLLYLCKQAKASTYLTGPSASNYLDETLFQQEQINIEWMNYTNYIEYPQLFPPFDHGVTILDLIFNTGMDSIKYFIQTTSS
ncbi:MAG TPA: WbqC family protein [Cyclobacteriaceae bacterium]|nr:WbqC family protein [Cyclobacteriaceae bacterium]